MTRGGVDRVTTAVVGLGVMASGAIALSYETIWLRRTALLLGGGGMASALTVGCFLLGLALGAAMVRRLPGTTGRVWAGAELLAACWALAGPLVHGAVWALVVAWPSGRWLWAGLAVLVPAVPLGATWPVLARTFDAGQLARFYALNTLGAVGGTVVTSLLLLPALGLRTTELLAVGAGCVLAWAVWDLPGARGSGSEVRRWSCAAGVAAVSGAVAMALEVAWFRLASVAFGGSVQVHAVVLAVFLAMVAAGAAVGARRGGTGRRGLGAGLVGLGTLALVGPWTWGQLPLWTAAVYRWGGPEALLPGQALLAAVLMGGAPLASGMVFSQAVRAAGRQGAPGVYVANTAAGIVGALGSAWALPLLAPSGLVLVASSAALAVGMVLSRAWWVAVPVAVLVGAQPAWDAKLYAVGVHLHLHEFVDPSAAAVRRFADAGWTLRSYEHGRAAAVAVGQSTRTGNVWLSLDGKVDASTGDDMPTQELSGTLPVRAHGAARDVLVVGLASGVTAGAVLAEPGVESLTLVELEPAVVRASHAFDHVNGRPLDDPRTTLLVDDARAVLTRTDRRWDVVVSEPSNPWISGVSNLFTHEYWTLAASRLRPGGVMCQWVQLYGLPPSAFRALVRTFDDVFDEVWLFETIPGSDALLIGSQGPLDPDRIAALPLAPTLGPAQTRRLGRVGWLNTDDHPRIEWEAPRWLHVPTGGMNRDLIAEAAH